MLGRALPIPVDPILNHCSCLWKEASHAKADKTEDDPDDYPTIVQINEDSYDESKKKWWILVTLEHKLGPKSCYPDKEDWLDWQGAMSA